MGSADRHQRETPVIELVELFKADLARLGSDPLPGFQRDILIAAEHTRNRRDRKVELFRELLERTALGHAPFSLKRFRSVEMLF